jgi:hypothetical protein
VEIEIAGDALLAPALLRRLLDEYVSRPQPGHASLGACHASLA